MASPAPAAAPVAPVFVSYHLDNTLGALCIGTLYGVTTVQMYMYFQEWKSDARMMKLTMAFLWLLETLHQIMVTHGLYTYAVTDYGNPQTLLIALWSVLGITTLSATIELIVRSVFCFRLWRLVNKNVFMVAPMFLLSLLEFGGGITFTAKGAQCDGQYALFKDFSWVVYVSLGSGVVADIGIASLQSWMLWHRRTGIKRTDSIVRLLVAYSINTGLLTSLCAVACFLAFATMNDNFVYISFYHMLPKLLLNSLLATLNARQHLRKVDDPLSLPMQASRARSTRQPFSSPTVSNNDKVVLEERNEAAIRSGTDWQTLAIRVETHQDTKFDPEI
ncbi:hypothetical protein CERSUDRAFT_95830 [Gelatoporia subvermispora B]|uniref:DUF6534 domain-containing protein n=1 Tax=Ceriporiopsis subvermispora (strain B) TaxID=914234 RepID=M2RCL7_CERS8|nr:hypothetical protein CERSUDRAFT_95830 [Gelatoporia subvermispora B]